jgi:hypothetical protein
MSKSDVGSVNDGVQNSKYKGFIAGVFSGIAKLTGELRVPSLYKILARLIDQTYAVGHP